MLLVNAKGVSDYFKENMQVSVLMKDSVPEEKAVAFSESSYIKHIEIESEEDEELIEFSDVDYGEDTTEDFGSETKTDLCEDSK